MKVLYQINSLESVYAARFIYEGYKDAFLELGHEFRPFTSNDNLEKVLPEYTPDIFITSLVDFYLKFLDLDLLKKYREKGLVMFTQIRPWLKQNDVPWASNLKEEKNLVDLIKKGLAGDVFFHWLEQDDPSMEGFTKETGYPYHTVILAANTKKYYYDPDDKYKADISFVGSFLPTKRKFLNEHVRPLMNEYKVQIYGSDWTLPNRMLGYIQKAGQYFNIEPLKHVRKFRLPLDDERKVYSSSTISLNVHEDHQRLYGSDFNERTLKIIASGGFEICDKVAVIRRYFKDNELVLADNTQDWFDKIAYYIKYPEKRLSIIEAGKNKILREHTYKNRVEQLLSIYDKK